MDRRHVFLDLGVGLFLMLGARSHLVFVVMGILYVAVFVLGLEHPVLGRVPGFRSRTRWKAAVACLFYGVLLMGLISPWLPIISSTVSTDSQAEAPSNSLPAQPTLEERLCKAMGVKAFEDFEVYHDYDTVADPEGFIGIGQLKNKVKGRIEVLCVVWQQMSIWSEASFRRDLLSAATSGLQMLHESGFPDLVVMIAQTELTDAYGRANWQAVMELNLLRETADRIVWRSFRSENLPVIADRFWEHSIFRSR